MAKDKSKPKPLPKTTSFPCAHCHKNNMPDGFTYWCMDCVKAARDAGLFLFMETMDFDDEPDGAWWAILEESVSIFNKANHTDYDPFNAVHMYLRFSDVYDMTDEDKKMLEGEVQDGNIKAH